MPFPISTTHSTRFLEATISAIELDLLAAMIDQGDLTPINKGWVTLEHMLTTQGQSLYHFLKNYRAFTQGRGRIPTRRILEERFGTTNALLPDTHGNEDLAALAYEARIAKVRAELRGLSENAAIIAEMTDPLDEISAIRKQFDSISADFAAGNDLLLSDAINDQLIDYDAGDILKEGMPWLWPSLTKATRGLHREEFIVICGRPKARKTFVATALAMHAFRTYGARVLFITPEMPVKQIMLRSTATLAALGYGEFKNCDLTPEEEQRLFEAASYYGKKNARRPKEEILGENEQLLRGDQGEDVPQGTEPLWAVVKGTGQGLGFVASKIEEYRPDIVLVDSFYRLDAGDSRKNDADWKAVTNISRGLKDLAMAESVCIIGTHQLNREADKGIGSLANLALADAIGQDADLIARVITAKRTRTADRSAIFLLGGRETAIDGVMINNVPCSDFTEIEEIIKRDKVLALLQEEDEQADGEDKTKLKAKKRKKAKVAGIAANTRAIKTVKKNHFSEEEEEEDDG